MTNCLNCGAPINSYTHIKCPYCSTDYLDFAPFDTQRPFYIKIKDQNRSYIAKVLLNTTRIEQTPDANFAINISLSVINEIGEPIKPMIIFKEEENA